MNTHSNTALSYKEEYNILLTYNLFDSIYPNFSPSSYDVDKARFIAISKEHRLRTNT
jgi:hypothetical protein